MEASANVKVKGKAKPAGFESAKLEMPKFDLPKMEVPAAFREIAEKSVSQAKENYEKMKAASGEMVDILRETYSTNAKGVADYGSKIIEISGANTTAAFDFLTSLMGTKSLSEVINLSTTQSRKSVEAVSAQNRELWALAQKVATETAEPIKKSFSRVLQKTS